ncbi:hypothetical protein B0O99DRAFT_465011, partial [Bisporella sp. PMI_857]
RSLGKFIFGFDMIRYAVSKAANFLFAQKLQRQLNEQGLPILFIAVHPDVVATEGVITSNTASIRIMACLSFFTPDQSTASPLFAAAAKEVRQYPEKYKKKFLVPIGKVMAPNLVAEDEKQVKGPWKSTIKEVNRHHIADSLP